MEPTINTPTEVGQKKKRGRKPKAVPDGASCPATDEGQVTVAIPDTVLTTDPDPATPPHLPHPPTPSPPPSPVAEKPPPKKRGRKPKGGKVVAIDPVPQKHTIIKQNIILHLKCSLKDIDGAGGVGGVGCVFVNQHDDLGNTSKSAPLNYHVISGTDASTKTTIGGKTCFDSASSSSTNDSECGSSHDITLKLKELQQLLHTNDISDKKSACFWCTYGFDNPAICIPKYKVNTSYHVYGCFCSPECATSYLYSENIDTSVKFERYQLINYIYSKIYNYTRNIKPAPNPHYLLDKYFGNLTIGEYRKLLRNDRLLMVIDKPLTRILPELHEETNNFMMTTQNDNTNTGIYQVKKKSVNPVTKNSIVNETFGTVNIVSTI